MNFVSVNKAVADDLAEKVPTKPQENATLVREEGIHTDHFFVVAHIV
jgi:hypothetical protein